MERFRAYGTTRTGLVRRSNEDHILLERSIMNRGSEQKTVQAADAFAERSGVLLAVADGIGGEAGGAIASRLALVTLERRFDAADKPSSTRPELIDSVRSAAEHANQAVLEASEAEPRLARMGCTLTGVCLHQEGYLVFNAGDSRVYRFRQGSLECLTRDDSMASLVVEAGAMTAEEAARSPIGHTLTNCVGSREFQVRIQERAWQSDDILLACSDGLYDMVRDERILDILINQQTLEGQTESLVDEALANGGNDNVSIVLIAAD